MWIHSIRVDGAELELGDVSASLSILHGRQSVYDEPTASTCSLTVLDPPRSFTRAFEVGADLAIDVDLAAGRPGTPPDVVPRFRGRVSDSELTDPELRVGGAGRLAELRRAGSVSTDGWPAQSWTTRCQTLLAAAGLAPADYRVIHDPLFNPLLEPPPEDEISIGGYLAELANTVGAAVYDDFAGVIVIEAIGRRLWDAGSQPPAIVAPIALDPADVAYSPIWRQELDVANSVTVLYGPDRSTSVTVADPASRDRYGGARVEISTTIADVDDARVRAQTLLERRAYPRWQIAPVYLLEGDDRSPYTIGRRVHLSALPPSAPFASWTPFLEGWADVIDGPRFAIRLSVSDPVSSGFYPAWRDAGATTQWAQLAAGLEWRDVETADQIGGAP